MTTVLIVDDEWGIRFVLNEFFRKREEASRVFLAENGEEGFRKFYETHVIFDLILTDINMPEMNGDEMVREIRKIDPEVPVIFMSGIESNFQGLADLENVDFVQKPFKIVDLKEKIQKLLAKK